MSPRHPTLLSVFVLALSFFILVNAKLSSRYVSFLKDFKASFSGWPFELDTANVDSWCSIQDSTGHSFLVCSGSSVSRMELFFEENTLFGTIPDIFDRVDSNFQEFAIHQQRGVHGTIPPTLLDASLEIISIRGTNITGEISNTVSPILVDLNLSDNLLTGGLPDFIGDATSLQFVTLNNNNLYGPLKAISPSMLSLDVSENELSGSLEAISQSRLVSFFGEANFFTTLPTELPRDMSILVLSSNNITGSIPKSFFEGRITQIDLSDNLLYGSVPPVGNNLRRVNLENNLLSICPDERTFNNSRLIECKLSCNNIECGRCDNTHLLQWLIDKYSLGIILGSIYSVVLLSLLFVTIVLFLKYKRRKHVEYSKMQQEGLKENGNETTIMHHTENSEENGDITRYETLSEASIPEEGSTTTKT